MASLQYERNYLLKAVAVMAQRNNFTKIDFKAYQFLVDRFLNDLRALALRVGRLNSHFKRLEPRLKDIYLAMKVLNTPILQIESLLSYYHTRGPSLGMRKSTVPKGTSFADSTVNFLGQRLAAKFEECTRKVMPVLRNNYRHLVKPLHHSLIGLQRRNGRRIKRAAKKDFNSEDPVLNEKIVCEFDVLNEEKFLVIRPELPFDCHGLPISIPIFTPYTYENDLNFDEVRRPMKPFQFLHSKTRKVPKGLVLPKKVTETKEKKLLTSLHVTGITPNQSNVNLEIEPRNA